MLNPTTTVETWEAETTHLRSVISELRAQLQVANLKTRHAQEKFELAHSTLQTTLDEFEKAEGRINAARQACDDCGVMSYFLARKVLEALRG